MLSLAILAWGPIAFGCVEPWSIGILEALAFWAALLGFRKASANGASLNPGGSLPLLWAVLALAGISLAQALHPGNIQGPVAAAPFSAAPFFARKATLLWLAYAAVLWSTARSLTARFEARRFAWAFFLLGAFVAFVGIIQYYGSDNKAIYFFRSVDPGYWPFGPYYNVDHAACMMGMSALVGAGLLLSYTTVSPLDSSAHGLTDKIAIGVVIAFLIAIILRGIWMTSSRGAILSITIAASSTCLMAALLKRGRPVWLLAACAVPVGLVMYFSTARTFSHIFDFHDLSTRYRLSMYRSALEFARDFPLFGVGPRGFLVGYPAYQDALVDGRVEFAHCDWLELVLNSGLAGTLAFGTGLLASLWRVISLWFRSESAESSCLAGGGIAAVLAFLIHGFVEFNFQIPANAVSFLCLIAWLGSAALTRSSQDVNSAARSRRRSSLRIGPSAAYAFAALLAAFSLRPAAASAYSWRAATAPLESRPFFLERAFAWHHDPRLLYERALIYWRLAEGNPNARVVFLRLALVDSSRALEAMPLESRYRRLYGTTLWYLGRQRDAAPYLPTEHHGS